MQEKQEKVSSKVQKYNLANGMTVLVKPSHLIPKVSLQLWYNVGSKDEGTGEKGLAHLIEHMIFKGTEKLSESDINEITHKLSGMCNAFTSFDYTGYLFDFPSQNWRIALPIMADCMRNCTFNEQFLNSELKAVIQELKLYKDNYPSTLLEDMIAAIFPDHPYHHPIIGYKQDLWSLDRNALINFYKKHYVPNNATLVIVGDVDTEEAFALAERAFAGIEPDPAYRKKEFYINKDLVSQAVTLYRDVQQPMVMLGWTIPGSKEKLDYTIDVLAWIFSGKGSRLHQKLIDELELVTDIEAFSYDLFDSGLFFIAFQPKSEKDIDRIIDLIHEEIASLVHNGIPAPASLRAQKQAEKDFLGLLESNQKQAYMIGKFFLSSGDENFLFKYLEDDPKKLTADVIGLLQNYFRPTLTHVGTLLPLPEQEKSHWLVLQERSDEEDERILAGRVRTLPVQPAVEAKTIVPAMPGVFDYPKHAKFKLKNGLEILFYDNKNLPKIELILEFKAKHYYDPENLQGLATFMSALLLEGTKQHTGTELAQEIESYGMAVSSSAGYMTLGMLTPDLERGLTLFADILQNSLFEERAVEKIRQQLISDIKNYWDDPSEFSSDLVRQHVYRGHPYSKSKIGTLESIQKITRADIFDFYKKYVTPQGARLSIVGDLNQYDVAPLFEKTLGQWQGPQVPDLQYPALQEIEYVEINYPINRDQVVLVFAGLSIDRSNPDFDKLLIFDQIFTGGVLGSMSSRLFQLREQTGLFYTIGGSVIAHADEQPGMIYIRTIVSNDRLNEAEKAIKENIAAIADTITPDELDQARGALINSMVDNFEADRAMAATFLALERYKLPANYFDTRAQDFAKITLDDVKAAVKKVLDANKLAIFKIGRVR
jgi:zinc protease